MNIIVHIWIIFNRWSIFYTDIIMTVTGEAGGAMIVYTPLWKTMKEKNVTTYTLISKFGMSSHTVHRLRHNMGISTQLINDLCRILDCRVEDILLYQPDIDEK